MNGKRFLIPGLVTLLMTYSCATVRTSNERTGSLKRLVIEEPIYIEVGKNKLQAYDDETLFKKAEEALDNDNLDKGIYFYYILLKKFPSSPLVPATLYNIGATYEEKKQYEKAKKFYQYLIEHFPHNNLAPRAMFRMALILEREKEYENAIQFINRLEKKKLNSSDRLKLTVLKGVLLTETGYENKGIQLLQIADKTYSKKFREGKRVDNYFWGWARFAQAEIIFKKFQTIHITGTTKEEIKKQLEQKASLLLKAMNLYFRTLKTHSMHWATAAVYRMGLLYELFYVEIASVNPPSQLNKEEKEVYYEELDKVLMPVKKKAMETYQKIIWYAHQWGINTPWIEKAKQHLEILREFKIYRPKG